MGTGELDEYQDELEAAVKRYRAAADAAAKAKADIPEPRRNGEAIDLSGTVEPNRELDEARIALRRVLKGGPYPAKTAADRAGLSDQEFLDVTRY
jgi:hypothetical protein